MPNQGFRNPDDQDSEKTSEGVKGFRLSPDYKSKHAKNLDRTDGFETTSKQKPRVIHPMVGWVMAAIIAGSVIAFRNSHSTIISPQQAASIVDPQLRPAPVDPAADQRYRDSREALQTGIPGQVVFPNDAVLAQNIRTGYKLVQMMFDNNGSSYYLNSMTALASGNLDPLGSQKTFIGDSWTGWRAGLIARMEGDLRKGNRTDAVQTAKDALSIFPMLNRAVGTNVPETSQVTTNVGAQDDVMSFLMDRNLLTPQEKQEILNTWKPHPAKSPLEHDALVRTLSDSFIPNTLNPASRYKLVSMLSVPATLPIDEKSTMEMANTIFLSVDKNLDGNYAHRDLTPEHQYATLDKELAPLLDGDPFANQGFFDAAKTRWTVYWHTNVIGKYLVYHQIPELLSFQKTMFINRTNYEAGRLRLALVTYSSTHNHQLPKQLSDLVGTKILDKIPDDPMTGQPFGYDPSRSALWSAGENGKDDGGLPKKDILYGLDDTAGPTIN